VNAQRYSGAYSPGASGAAGAPTVRRGTGPVPGLRAWLLFLLPTPLLFSALGSLGGGRIFAALIDLAAYGLLLGGAFLLREGLKAELAFAERRIARPPAFPRKLVAAVLAGDGVFLATFFGWGQGLVTAIAFGALATAAHLLAFGLDPMRAKGVAEHGADGERAAEALERAEAQLAAILALAPGLGDREVQTRVTALVGEVRQMLRLVEEDPRDLDRARRYLSVYLKGAHEATRKYAENHARLNDPKLRADYLELVSDLEASFGRGRQMLLQDNRTDLEVEIEVLRERLGQEGA
jgi:hypothetical protein